MCEFERWIYDAMTEVADLRRNTVENEVGIDDKGVKAMMHRMAEAGVPKAHTKLYPLERARMTQCS